MNENYEKFKHQLMMNLMENDINDIEKILKIVDIVSQHFSIAEMEVLPTIYEGGIPQVVKEYMVEKKLQGYSQTLLQNELYIFKKFFETINKDVTLIQANDIRAFIYSYQLQNNIGNRTLDKYRSWLATFFKWCFENGYVDKDPMAVIKPIKYEYKKRDALNSTQWEIFRNIPKDKTGRMMLEFLYSTGCRVAEMCSVKIRDINLDAREVIVMGKGNKQRSVYLNDRAYILLKEYIKDKPYDEYLFTNVSDKTKPFTTNGVRKKFESWGKKCPEFPFKVTPHIIRHTMATTLLDRGVPIEQISAMLGHSQLETTMIYINLNTNQLKESHRKYII